MIEQALVTKIKNKSPGIKDIAQIAGVNVSTVSRALSNNAQISAKMKSKISGIARDLGYKKNMAAYSLKVNRSMVIDVLFPKFNFIMSDYYANILHGVDTVLSCTHYSMSFSNLEKRDILENKISSQRLDGLLIIGDDYRTSDYEYFSQIALPKVFVSAKLPPRFRRQFNVYADVEFSTHLITDRLYERALPGKLLFLTGDPQYETTKAQLRGFRQKMEELGLEYDIVHSSFAKGPDGGYTFIESLQGRGPFPYTAILCGSDEMAMGISRGIYEYFQSDYNKIIVAGHDNTRVARYFPKPIPSVDYNPMDQGKTAAKIVIEQIESDEEILPRSICVQPSVI